MLAGSESRSEQECYVSIEAAAGWELEPRSPAASCHSEIHSSAVDY
jgi:hypothetical protein